jgi:hypothetical protein
MSADWTRNFLFYTFKPIIPRRLQIFLRRQIAQRKRKKYAHVWPIDPNAAAAPKAWPGWPKGKRFGFVLSHDVDTRKGYNNVLRLADLEEEMGFRSQFNFVPERYGQIEIRLIEALKQRGFGIGVHGLTHDGKLFSSKEIFNERAPRINAYLEKWGTRTFTAPSMIRNHQWMQELDIDFCVSTFDTDPFEPQSDGARTIFPYWVSSDSSRTGFLELPYTLVQDFTLFIIIGETTIELWKQKLDWIAEQGGLALLNSHPDYMNFGSGPCGLEEYPVSFYREFLQYVKGQFQKDYWHALPSQVWHFWTADVKPYVRQDILETFADSKPLGHIAHAETKNLDAVCL